MINYTEHNKLAMPDLNSPADIRVISEVISNIDDGLSKFYVATSNTKNLYNITTGINKTELKNGYSIKIGIPSDSDNNVTVSVDNIVIPVKKPNGNPVKNFKANGVYSLTYYNGNFILASGGVDDVNFSTSDLLENKTANNSDGEKVNGTMKNNGAVSVNIGVNGSYTIPAGYHNGQGKVTQSITTRGAITNSISNVVSGDSLYTRIPQGAYFTNATSGYPEIKTEQAKVASAIGLHAGILLAGQNILGINGNVQPKLIQTGTATGTSNGRTELHITGLSFEPIYIVAISNDKDHRDKIVFIFDKSNTLSYNIGDYSTGTRYWSCSTFYIRSDTGGTWYTDTYSYSNGTFIGGITASANNRSFNYVAIG